MGSRISSISARDGSREGVVDLNHLPGFGGDFVAHVRQGGDDFDAMLPVEPFLKDLHVQESKESAAKTEPQRRRGFRFVREGGVVQSQSIQRVPKLGVLVRVDRVYPAEYHRFEWHVSRQGIDLRRSRVENGVPYPSF